MPKAIPRATMRGRRVDMQARKTVSMSEKAASMPVIKRTNAFNSYRCLASFRHLHTHTHTHSHKGAASNLSERRWEFKRAAAKLYTTRARLTLLIKCKHPSFELSTPSLYASPTPWLACFYCSPLPNTHACERAFITSVIAVSANSSFFLGG